MTSCSRGDIVLIKFVFADEKGAKQRPGLIVSADRYHRGRQGQFQDAAFTPEFYPAAVRARVAAEYRSPTAHRGAATGRS